MLDAYVLNLVLFSVMLVIFNVALNHRVNRRTADLRAATAHLRQEIEERKRVEESLRESEATLRTLINGNPESVFLIDTHGVILAANDILAMRFGKSPDAIIGRRIDDLMPAEIARE